MLEQDRTAMRKSGLSLRLKESLAFLYAVGGLQAVIFCAPESGIGLLKLWESEEPFSGDVRINRTGGCK